MEVWKEVEGYEGIYEVSNLGRIRSLDRVDDRGRHLKGRELKQVPAPVYLTVSLCNCGKRSVVKVHSVVAKAFVPGCAEGLEVCHNDGNRFNNSASNLRWDSAFGNAQDKVIHGHTAVGSKNGRAKLTEEVVAEIKTKLEAGAIRNHLRKEYKVSFQTIERIATGESWRHA